MVKQNSVFVENTPGSLQKVTKILAENQIDIYGFGCFDAPEFANFRMVCDNPERADEIAASDNAVALINEKAAEYQNLQSSAMAAAKRGYVDDIVNPEDTRKRVIAAFDMLFTKREDRPAKKHGTV